ncbi:hypothetical protein DXD68_00055 [Parabacteroides sp. TM07-1AC]|uniref:DUF5682 family protein n=1 Tax=Parabacteroides sp. TM07-1AC TaxID=2292363 RepID=UPI000EFDCC5C|nr:DUF5682 family protein [Parabacteroides sp. TM07-1AC]RHU30266.1 hypothetical protein DXD68_00055 [Parabacteroides sp. TM07-1AC]
MEGILRQPDLAEIDRLFTGSFDMDGQVVYFPVRHHSPACALHLRRTIERFRPELILIEGPSDSAELLPYIADEQSVPPFCIYYSYDDKDGKVNEEKEKYRAYYPFLAYSPELVAIREGTRSHTPVRFIDLPYALRLINKIEEEPQTQFYYNENKEYEVNTYTAMIARKAGCRSFAEFWESRFELDAANLETQAFVRNLFHLGYFMRLATPENEISLKEDRLRETYMAEEIRKALPDNKKILVIAGAFHISGLMEALQSDKKPSLKTCNREHVASYLMPYTFKEADSKSGYAAGMPFPAFYQEVWEKIEKQKKDPFASTVLEYIIKTARYARKTQMISLPDEINALNMARSLAVLRGKQSTGVYELLDGVRSCFVKGDLNATSTFEVDFLYRLLSGMGTGKIADNDCIPPVVHEFRVLCSLHRLKTSTIERQEVTLDIIKNPAHYRKSRFLHQMEFLETGFATLQSGPDYVNQKNKNLVREQWICRYATGVETRLIDLSVYGATLSQVCNSLIEKNFKDNMTAEELGKLLLSVQVMGIEGFYLQYEDTIRLVVESEGNFINLCKLINSLLYLANMQQLMDGNIQPVIAELARTAFKGAVVLIPSLKSTTEEEEQEICEQMRNLYSFTMDAKGWFDTAAFIAAVEKVLNDSFSNSRLFGLCLAIHYKEGRTGQATFCQQIAAYLESSITHPEQAASFICGLFLIARDVLFVDPHILEAINRVIANADQETFLTILPNLRYAFTGFLPAEISRLGQQVAEYHQVSEARLTGSITVSQEEITEAMRLDSLAAEALKTWRIA